MPSPYDWSIKLDKYLFDGDHQFPQDLWFAGSSRQVDGRFLGGEGPGIGPGLEQYVQAQHVHRVSLDGTERRQKASNGAVR